MAAPTRTQVLQALMLATTAARRNLPVTTCPYDPNSPDPTVRMLALTWVREYQRRRPPARRT